MLKWEVDVCVITDHIVVREWAAARALRSHSSHDDVQTLAS